MEKRRGPRTRAGHLLGRREARKNEQEASEIEKKKTGEYFVGQF